jgi:hypothetical protein
VGSKVLKAVRLEHDVTLCLILPRGKVAFGTGPGTKVPWQWSRTCAL